MHVILSGTSVECCNTVASVSSQLVIPVQADQPCQIRVSEARSPRRISGCVLKDVCSTDTSNSAMQTPYLKDNTRSASQIHRHV